MIEKIAHLADIHVRKSTSRNEEYNKVFENLIASLEIEKPDRIVIVGDLVHDYLELQGEQLIMVHKLLNRLAKIAPVRVTRGNHDCLRSNLKRVDSVKAIVETLNNPFVVYYDTTGFYADDNVVWAVWHHREPKNNPWKRLKDKDIIADLNSPTSTYTTIDLFHDPVNGCKTPNGLEMKSKTLYKLSDFKGNYSFFGDIHKLQYLDKAKHKAYCGSLIAQDVSEGDDSFHGYILWDIANDTRKEVAVESDYSFKNIKVTPYIDFDDLDFEIDNPTKFMKIRFLWCTLPQTRTPENERKLIEYVNSKHKNLTISHKNEFIENEKIDVNEKITLVNVTNKAVQHEIFREYLTKIGTDAKIIEDVIALDEEILNEIDVTDDESIEWNIIKFGGTNFMSYGSLDIDWREMDGIFQITGINTAGKTTIMKLISYILYGKTLETESRMKYGDQRFVNNRNNANFCSGYLVIEANGEYYGIKKKTELSRAKDGSVNGAPTALSYYVLNNPDDEMNDETSIEKLDGDRKVKTQKKIESIIGSYENFMRIVMTTSDTLNRILSNDMAVFIDSLLFDSGLDIFDKKLEGLKTYTKKVNEKPRIACDVVKSTEQNAVLTQEIRTLESEIVSMETIQLPDVQKRILSGRTYQETITKKLFKIDPEIYELDVDIAREDISAHKKSIVEIMAREMVLKQSIKSLKDSYDEKKLVELNEKKDTHKTNEYAQKLKIKAFEQVKTNEEHAIEIINGDIFRLKKDGAKYKTEIQELKESKTCPTCGQPMSAKHQEHVDGVIKTKETEMFKIADQINTKENVDKKKHLDSIEVQKKGIEDIQKDIEKSSLEMETILKQIGNLTNDKNDVEKRKELQNELDQVPTRIQNEELKIKIIQQKIDNHENSLLQIEENKRIEKGIAAAKQKIVQLEAEESDIKEDIFINKTNIGDKQLKIKNNELLIAEFKIQEYNDSVMNLYKKCVHRDGIPRQMLVNYIIPKINVTLESILSVAPFKIWLDIDDLRPKLVYNNRPTSIIDCIGASGKERTFSSVVLKFALNQINVKAKPTIFLLDEVMGKLDENSVEEFIEILQLIKKSMKKVLVVEHVREINPDYLINVTLGVDGISSVVLE